METQVKQSTDIKSLSKLKVWIKRIGVVGFIFFLVKGLVWLAIFLGVGRLF
ncbi:hypothetical protein K6119_17900 [Paracrocinitomix mangrovi]|uniref:hypothetical protein n=1 Tax=Paracrocinitomix mangrovi TaxID=2862509 RepID=UPI001C8D680B|nr:hypothetical protein [Paracrocinitomix mangrovi]UKN01599.1 hypothetical protein K6119_17900 [Paracrocinitomix mangrovi]